MVSVYIWRLFESLEYIYIFFFKFLNGIINQNKIKYLDNEDKTKQPSDPQAPVTRKGVLMSFKTGKPIEIPENDMVLLKNFVFHNF